MRRTGALIAGGGPAGAAAAIRLAHGGARPLLIERSYGMHDPVCGGFLSWEALSMLETLGISTEDLSAQPVTTLMLATRKRKVEIALPFAAAGVSRRTLDAALLARAEASGAGVERGCTIKRIDPHARTLNLADGGHFAGDALFLATGKHDVRGAARCASAGDDPPVGIRVRLQASGELARRLGGRIEMFLLDRGYAGLVLQEPGYANLCLTVAQSRFVSTGGVPERLLSMLAEEQLLLGERLAQAISYDGWATTARTPYGWQAKSTEDGIFRLGDQAAVIASLAGDGMAIALDSGISGAEQYLRDGPKGATAYQNGLAQRARAPIRRAGYLRWMAERPIAADAAMRLVSQFPSLARAGARATRIRDIEHDREARHIGAHGQDRSPRK